MKQKFKYISIKIPEALAKILDKVIEKSDGLFTSKTDLIKYEVLHRYWRKEDDETNGKENISNSRTDGRASAAAGNGLAGCENTGEKANTGSQTNAGIEQHDPGKGREGIAINMGETP